LCCVGHGDFGASRAVLSSRSGKNEDERRSH
jgi:hypothetical protein